MNPDFIFTDRDGDKWIHIGAGEFRFTGQGIDPFISASVDLDWLTEHYGPGIIGTVEPEEDMWNPSVIHEIALERKRQVALWGEQNHSDLSKGDYTQSEMKVALKFVRQINEANIHNGTTNWYQIMREELLEAVTAESTQHLREELIQCAAVILAWIEDVDRRTQ